MHTKAYLNLELTRKEIYEIARTIATEKSITGISKFTKDKLINFILENQAQGVETEPTNVTETTEDITFISIPSPEGFFNLVKGLDSKIKVHQACNALLDIFSEKYAVSTISKKLAAYRKPFYHFQHSNPSFNETVETKNGYNTQHIAGKLLSLSEEQQKELSIDIEKRAQARAGFTDDGDIREVDRPKTDITAVIKKSCECLGSTDPHTVGVGIINLTGLRANEQNQPKRSYPKWGEIIEREMVVLDDYVVGFKGLSKKGDLKDTNTFYARATLAPAQLIVAAHNRFLSSTQVKSIPADYESYRKGFMDTFNNRFRELFGETLSTVEAYDDNGNLTKDNGSSHRGRAFYACALRAILKAKKFKDSAANKYIQLSLAHSKIDITIKYLGRYDESDFINPVSIDIPTNIKELGKMDTAVIERAKADETASAKPINKGVITTTEKPQETVTKVDKPIQDAFKPAVFLEGIPADLQIKFTDLINSGIDFTQALIQIVNLARISGETPKNKVQETEGNVDLLIATILDYNMNQPKRESCVIPTYALVNRLSKERFDKEISRQIVERAISAKEESINTRLSHKELPAMGTEKNTKWNGKYHRRDMKQVTASILEMID